LAEFSTGVAAALFCGGKGRFILSCPNGARHRSAACPAFGEYFIGADMTRLTQLLTEARLKRDPRQTRRRLNDYRQSTHPYIGFMNAFWRLRMRVPTRLMFACAALCLLPVNLSRAQDIKAPIRGLVSMGAYRFVGYGGDPVNTLEPLNAKPGIFGGLVVIASWKQLQPTPQSEIGDNNVIDQALAQVRAYNERNPDKPLGVKLRVWGGFQAPDWAKQLGGIAIETVYNDKPRVLGRFWSPAYRQAWTRLQQQLAARFDKEPLIKEVAITSCMSYTAEPFYLPMVDSVAAPLGAAGFTWEAYKDCLSGALSDYAPWKQSRLVLSVNPLRTGAGQGNGDPGFTQAIMRNCRQTIGERVRQPRSRCPTAAVALQHLRNDEAAGT
jgi:hypothetical protein